MINPTKLKMTSNVPVASFKVQCLMGPAEQVIKETVIEGPFAAGEDVEKDIFADALSPMPPPFSTELRLRVWGRTAFGDSSPATTDAFSFTLPAAPTLVLS